METQSRSENKAAWLSKVRLNPGAFLHAGRSGDVPIDWLAEAWDLPEVQSTVARDFVETVRSWPPEPFLHETEPEVPVLQSCLSAGQVTSLFLLFRERWPACEYQLREEFQVFFGDRTAGFPLPLTFAEVVQRMDGDEVETKAQMEKYWKHPALALERVLAVPLPEGDSDLGYAAGLLLRAIQIGWIRDQSDLAELRDHLARLDGWGSDEILFEPRANRLQVSFLDEDVSCDLQAFLAHLDDRLAAA